MVSGVRDIECTRVRRKRDRSIEARRAHAAVHVSADAAFRGRAGIAHARDRVDDARAYAADVLRRDVRDVDRAVAADRDARGREKRRFGRRCVRVAREAASREGRRIRFADAIEPIGQHRERRGSGARERAERYADGDRAEMESHAPS